MPFLIAASLPSSGFLLAGALVVRGTSICCALSPSVRAETERHASHHRADRLHTRLLVGSM